CQQHDDSPFTF
nr:immunoglobulin light chain junction region [Macaca mulatta]MOX48050.1 immunoglobulin light chain junction region [Macaca mulatta]MOX48321.1 immunoglobulin light chain junction region [Macaca mulatta]MOX48451.1 immunoglobulin light chain junction region [Macaca mulatta]MOX48597.1 immunoglobulin light chain junction region [Macaca mulatta]